MAKLWKGRGKPAKAEPQAPRKRGQSPAAEMDLLTADDYLERISAAIGLPIYDGRDAALEAGLPMPDERPRGLL